MAIRDARDLFVYELSGLHSLEKSIRDDLPTMVSQCHSDDCRNLFQHDQDEVQRQIDNLDQCFQVLGREPVPVTNYVVEGIRRERESFEKQASSPDLVELFNLDAASRLEHMEIAAYRGLLDKAQQMGEYECARLLEDNLRMEEEESHEVEQVACQASCNLMRGDSDTSATS